MRKWLNTGVIFIVLAGTIAYLLVPSPSTTFSDHPTVVIRRGERYHVLPESKLTRALVIVDEQGERHYVISEEKLWLLGPRLLTGGE